MRWGAAGRFFQAVWKSRNPIAWLLWPVSLVYCVAALIHRICYSVGIRRISRFDSPIIAIGNITVGGTGKTPFTIWLVDYLLQKGFSPGVVSRGYGRKDTSKSWVVQPNNDPESVGDEPYLIAMRTGVPVAVSKKRSNAISLLMGTTDCDIFVCDDALQHHSLAVDLKIALTDAEYRFGNGFCLPAGPLREPASRLKAADLQLVRGKGEANEHSMAYQFVQVVNIKDNENRLPIECLLEQPIIAVAGIGNPDSFFDMLAEMGVEYNSFPFADHHRFTENDFMSIDTDSTPIVMTEKDAVKCQKFAKDNWWYIALDVVVSDDFVSAISDRIATLNTS